MSQIQPLQDRVLVRPAKPDEVTKGGIILPDIVQERPQRGEVLAVGPGKHDQDGRLIPMMLAEGDIVLYGKFGGQEIADPETDEALLLMRESDIFARLV